MTTVGRLIVRVVSYATYVVLLAACVSFLLSEVVAVRLLGIFCVLFLIDAYLHLRQADQSFGHTLPKKINLAAYLTPTSYRTIEYAFERSLLVGGDFYLFLLNQLIGRKEIRGGIWRLGVAPEELQQKIDELLQRSLERVRDKNEKRSDRHARLLIMTEQVARFGFQNAMATDSRFIEPKDIFAALSKIDDPAIQRLFQLFNINNQDLENALIFSRFRIPWWQSWRLPSAIGGFVSKPHAIRHRVMNRAWSSRPTPVLDKHSQDLTDYARSEQIGFLIGHQEEYNQMLDVLARSTKPNVLLIGEPGAGKEALVAHLAHSITKDQVPENLFDKRIISLNIGSMVAGVDPGELQERVKTIIQEIMQAGNVILYIPDIHNLAKTSGKSYLSVVDTLLPAISGTDFSVIGATYTREFKQVIEPQTDFSSAFEVVRVEEVSEEEAIKILVYQSILLERQYKIVISFGAIKQAVLLAHKYFRTTLLPASAADLLKEALSNVTSKEERVVKADDVLDIAQRKVNIPLRQAKDAEAEKLLNLESFIHMRLVDQEPAVTAVAQALREYRSGLARKGGPIATFLFVGPTGVGKTELSKILASIQFGSANTMARFDMSEYQDKQSIFRFIGSPDGAVSGSLTEAILQRPYSLVLLDEFEKAHPDILNLFLQVFDDGRLTDNLGKVVDFQNTIIIATSNAHSDLIKTELEQNHAMPAIAELVKKKLTEYFKPELINRFSRIIVFKNLSPEDIKAIAQLQLKDLAKTLQESHKVDLQFDPAVIAKIAEWGYDPVFGARPLRGVIADKLRSVLAEKILKNEVVAGSRLRVVLAGDQIEFQAADGTA